MLSTKLRVAVVPLGLAMATLVAGSGAIAQDAPLRIQPQRAQSAQTLAPERTIPQGIVIQPQSAIPQSAIFATEATQTPTSQPVRYLNAIPPQPELCATDYSWFDYEQWEWICVGHQ